MYQEFYSLNKNPFKITPDPDVFFPGKEHSKVLSYFHYGLSCGEGFVVITGDIGTGKTTIVKALFQGLDSIKYITGYLESTFLKESELLEVVCQTFGLKVKGLTKGALLNQFIAFLHASHQSGRRVILMIDEVHNLPLKTVEEVRMLSNFQVDNKPLLQTFLVGQGEFSKLLKKPEMEQLKQRVVASWHLSALTVDETKDYINYRLKESGAHGAPFFDSDALTLIYELSEGVPRRINLFCDRLFLFGYIEEVRFFTCEHVNAVINELEGEVISPVKVKRSVDKKNDNTISEEQISAAETPVVEKSELVNLPDKQQADLVEIKNRPKLKKAKLKKKKKVRAAGKGNELPKLFMSF